jgi:hypothetical protein
MESSDSWVAKRPSTDDGVDNRVKSDEKLSQITPGYILSKLITSFVGDCNLGCYWPSVYGFSARIGRTAFDEVDDHSWVDQ